MRDRWSVTALNILLLGLAVATLVILLIVSTQVGNRFERDARGVDLVVGAKGSPLQLILSSLYQADTPTGNIPLASVAQLRRDPAVAQVIPIALGDNFRGYRIVGSEPAYFDLYDARLAKGRLFARPQEVVMGADVARTLGAGVGQRFIGSHGLSDAEGTTGHDESPFVTVGILAPTGGVIDRLIVTSIESVWDVHGIEHEAHEGDAGHADEAGHDGDDHAAETPAAATGLEPEVTALLVKYRSALGAMRVPEFVNRQTQLQAAVPAVETGRLLTLFGAGIDGARLFGWLLALTGGLSIFVALLNAARAREGDLALLRVMGATRGQVFGTILLEGLLTAAIGTVLGIALGHAAVALAASAFYSLDEFGIDPVLFHPGEAVIAAAVLGIGVLAAFIPALRIFRTDLATTLARA